MNSIKRIMASCIAVVMSIALAVSAYAKAFSDITDGNWYANPVRYCQAKGYVGGYPDGTFRPNRPVTRAEIATILCTHATVNGIKLPDTGAEFSAFKDANSGGLHEWNHEPVHWAVSRGIIAGYEDGTIRLNDCVTREQAAVILSNYFDIPKKVGKTTYSDNDDIHEWALSSVKGMTDTKHLAGMGDNRFSPSSLVTRAQVAQILMSFADVIEDTSIPDKAERNSRLEYVATGVWEYTTIKPVVREQKTALTTQAENAVPSFEEENVIVDKIEKDAEQYPTYREKLADPVVGMIATYDNWGELEEIYIPNGDGTFYIPERTWEQANA